MSRGMTIVLVAVVVSLWALAFILHCAAGTVPALIWQSAGGISLGLLVGAAFVYVGLDALLILTATILLGFCIKVSGELGTSTYIGSALICWLLNRRART